jgi:ABC-2 type transport system ATP-binding protein
MSEGRSIVEVRDLVKDVRPGFGLRRKRILHGISLDVREGEIFGFIGPNGAGKTTTLKVLMGLIRPTSGHARILGHDVRETAFRRHVGFLPENPYFYEFLTGREFLRFYARVSGVRRGEREGRISELLDWVGLTAAADQRLRTYSKGMLQRVGIAQARKEIRDLILRLHAEGKTVFMNTHILSDVELLCHRVAIIVQGRIRYAGSVDEFLDAGERESDLVLAGFPSELAEELEEGFGATLREIGDRTEVRVAEKHVGVVLERALARGAAVMSVVPHRVSLETIFLSAVEGGES